MTTDNMPPQACDVPLIEQLRGVPKDGRQMMEIHPTEHRNIPYGRMCHEAADALQAAEQQTAELHDADRRKTAEYNVLVQENRALLQQTAELRAELERMTALRDGLAAKVVEMQAKVLDQMREMDAMLKQAAELRAELAVFGVENRRLADTNLRLLMESR